MPGITCQELNLDYTNLEKLWQNEEIIRAMPCSTGKNIRHCIVDHIDKNDFLKVKFIKGLVLKII